MFHHDVNQSKSWQVYQAQWLRCYRYTIHTCPGIFPKKEKKSNQSKHTEKNWDNIWGLWIGCVVAGLWCLVPSTSLYSSLQAPEETDALWPHSLTRVEIQFYFQTREALMLPAPHNAPWVGEPSSWGSNVLTFLENECFKRGFQQSRSNSRSRNHFPPGVIQ